MKQTIIRNAARCKLCGTVVESTYRHNYCTCQCGNLSVDGGLDYVRRSYEQPDSWDELCEYAPAEQA